LAEPPAGGETELERLNRKFGQCQIDAKIGEEDAKRMLAMKKEAYELMGTLLRPEAPYHTEREAKKKQQEAEKAEAEKQGAEKQEADKKVEEVEK